MSDTTPPWRPKPQPLPRCPRHPARRCPGECQYILPASACWHDPIALWRARPVALLADGRRTRGGANGFQTQTSGFLDDVPVPETALRGET